MTFPKTSRRFMDLIDVDWPIVQAPMAGTSTPEMAAAVSNAGALGSIAVGAATVEAASKAIQHVRLGTSRPFNVNVFCHGKPRRDPDKERKWLKFLGPEFAVFNTAAPASLAEIYTSFCEDDAMYAVIREARPRVVSFHFGLPGPQWIAGLKETGIVLFATATSPKEAYAAVDAGVDVIVAQGYEAGGHRGVFDPDGPDDRLSTFPLVQLLCRELDVPVLAAGGIMDGKGIGAALQLGAAGVQLGTAFVATDESAADEGYRVTLFSDAARHTVMTRAISGRPARCLSNTLTGLGQSARPDAVPDYPIAYDAGKALNSAAKAAGNLSYGAHWAGQGAPLARALPAGQLVEALIEELRAG